jgi:hypothetical protein
MAFQCFNELDRERFTLTASGWQASALLAKHQEVRDTPIEPDSYDNTDVRPSR